eukprot:765237-Hanusia_phi.AAC.1
MSDPSRSVVPAVPCDASMGQATAPVELCILPDWPSPHVLLQPILPPNARVRLDPPARRLLRHLDHDLAGRRVQPAQGKRDCSSVSGRRGEEEDRTGVLVGRGLLRSWRGQGR